MSNRRADSLDDEAQAVIDLIEQADAPPIHTLSVSGARERMRRMFVPPDEPEPVGDVADYHIQGPAGDLPVRIYTPEGEGPHPVLVWYHGGGFVLGDLDTTDPACRALTNACEAIVISVDYRLAPEHPWPAGVRDCYAAVEWACEYAGTVGGDKDRVAVGGSSAGGNLAAVVSLMARDRGWPNLAHQLLVYPATHNDLRGHMPSYEENGEGYLLERADSAWFHEQYLARELDAYHSYAFPMQARTLTDLPPATIVTAGYDPLRDEGFAYAKRLEADGVEVSHRHYDDTIHGFFGMVGANELQHARRAIADVAADFREFV